MPRKSPANPLASTEPTAPAPPPPWPPDRLCVSVPVVVRFADLGLALPPEGGPADPFLLAAGMDMSEGELATLSVIVEVDLPSAPPTPPPRRRRRRGEPIAGPEPRLLHGFLFAARSSFPPLAARRLPPVSVHTVRLAVWQWRCAGRPAELFPSVRCPPPALLEHLLGGGAGGVGASATTAAAAAATDPEALRLARQADADAADVEEHDFVLLRYRPDWPGDGGQGN